VLYRRWFEVCVCDVNGRSVNKKTGKCVWWAALCTLFLQRQEQVPSAARLLCLPCCRVRKNTASTLYLLRRLVTVALLLWNWVYKLIEVKLIEHTDCFSCSYCWLFSCSYCWLFEGSDQLKAALNVSKGFVSDHKNAITDYRGYHQTLLLVWQN